MDPKKDSNGRIPDSAIPQIDDEFFLDNVTSAKKAEVTATIAETNARDFMYTQLMGQLLLSDTKEAHSLLDFARQAVHLDPENRLDGTPFVLVNNILSTFDSEKLQRYATDRMLQRMLTDSEPLRACQNKAWEARTDEGAPSSDEIGLNQMLGLWWYDVFVSGAEVKKRNGEHGKGQADDEIIDAGGTTDKEESEPASKPEAEAEAETE